MSQRVGADNNTRGMTMRNRTEETDITTLRKNLIAAQKTYGKAVQSFTKLQGAKANKATIEDRKKKVQEAKVKWETAIAALNKATSKSPNSKDTSFFQKPKGGDLLKQAGKQEQRILQAIQKQRNKAKKEFHVLKKRFNTWRQSVLNNSKEKDLTKACDVTYKTLWEAVELQKILSEFQDNQSYPVDPKDADEIDKMMRQAKGYDPEAQSIPETEPSQNIELQPLNKPQEHKSEKEPSYPHGSLLNMSDIFVQLQKIEKDLLGVFSLETNKQVLTIKQIQDELNGLIKEYPALQTFDAEHIKSLQETAACMGDFFTRMNYTDNTVKTEVFLAMQKKSLEDFQKTLSDNPFINSNIKTILQEKTKEVIKKIYKHLAQYMQLQREYSYSDSHSEIYDTASNNLLGNKDDEDSKQSQLLTNETPGQEDKDDPVSDNLSTDITKDSNVLDKNDIKVDNNNDDTSTDIAENTRSKSAGLDYDDLPPLPPEPIPSESIQADDDADGNSPDAIDDDDDDDDDIILDIQKDTPKGLSENEIKQDIGQDIEYPAFQKDMLYEIDQLNKILSGLALNTTSSTAYQNVLDGITMLLKEADPQKVNWSLLQFKIQALQNVSTKLLLDENADTNIAKQIQQPFVPIFLNGKHSTYNWLVNEPQKQAAVSTEKFKSGQENTEDQVAWKKTCGALEERLELIQDIILHDPNKNSNALKIVDQLNYTQGIIASLESVPLSKIDWSAISGDLQKQQYALQQYLAHNPQNKTLNELSDIFNLKSASPSDGTFSWLYKDLPSLKPNSLQIDVKAISKSKQAEIRLQKEISAVSLVIKEHIDNITSKVPTVTQTNQLKLMLNNIQRQIDGLQPPTKKTPLQKTLDTQVQQYKLLNKLKDSAEIASHSPKSGIFSQKIKRMFGDLNKKDFLEKHGETLIFYNTMWKINQNIFTKGDSCHLQQIKMAFKGANILSNVCSKDSLEYLNSTLSSEWLKNNVKNSSNLDMKKNVDDIESDDDNIEELYKPST